MATPDVASASIPELISGLVGDAKDIASGHATKMRGEIKEELGGLKQYLLKITIAVGIGVLGAMLLAHAFALILVAIGLPLWAGYLSSAAIAIAAGYVVIKRMPESKKDIDLIPESALADLKRDATTLKEEVTDEVKGRPAHAH
jgi:hypothetical protein